MINNSTDVIAKLEAENAKLKAENERLQSQTVERNGVIYANQKTYKIFTTSADQNPTTGKFINTSNWEDVQKFMNSDACKAKGVNQLSQSFVIYNSDNKPIDSTGLWIGQLSWSASVYTPNTIVKKAEQIVDKSTEVPF